MTTWLMGPIAPKLCLIPHILLCTSDFTTNWQIRPWDSDVCSPSAKTKLNHQWLCLSDSSNWWMANQLKTVILQIICYERVNFLLLFWNWKTFNEEKWQEINCQFVYVMFLFPCCNFLHILVLMIIRLFTCVCTENTLAMHFKIQQVYHITCKLSLLICNKILLQY